MDEYNKLLRRVQELEAENAELKERLKWRDAEKGLPNPSKTCPLCSDVVEVCVKLTFSQRIASGFYDYESQIWRTATTVWDEAEPTVIAWRPLNLPEDEE